MQIVFKDCPPLIVDLDPTPLVQRWQDLIKHNYEKNPNALFRDQQKYTKDLLKQLAGIVNQKLGWSWNLDDLSLESTVIMHKDIEKFLANGYSNIPEEFDDLLHEIHFCLHAVESGSCRSNWLQIEWFNDEGFDIPPDEYPGKIALDFGDIRLQNPYVGHHPLFIYQQNDTHNINQTCRFHDLARPGVCVVIRQEDQNIEFDWGKYFDWFEKHGSEFIRQNKLINLIKYTGHPVIGRVRNLKDLEFCVQKPVLEFDRFVWH